MWNYLWEKTWHIVNKYFKHKRPQANCLDIDVLYSMLFTQQYFGSRYNALLVLFFPATAPSDQFCWKMKEINHMLGEHEVKSCFPCAAFAKLSVTYGWAASKCFKGRWSVASVPQQCVPTLQETRGEKYSSSTRLLGMLVLCMEFWTGWNYSHPRAPALKKRELKTQQEKRAFRKKWWFSLGSHSSIENLSSTSVGSKKTL